MGAETVRQFPFVDAAVSGEADLVFPELAARVLAGGNADGLPGVRTRASVDAEFASGRFTNARPVQNLDLLPYPDYTDYFDQFGASRFAPPGAPRYRSRPRAAAGGVRACTARSAGSTVRR